MSKNNMDPFRKTSQPAGKNARKETGEQTMIEKAAIWLEKNKLELDDTFRFHCNKCGKCCINRDDILLSAKDIFYITKELGITPIELIEKYGEVYIGSETHIPVARLKPVGPDRRCPFLDNMECLIHKVKPSVCAMYPIGRAAFRNIDRSGEGTKIKYFFTNPECGDGNETHTLRDWLENFGIPLEDEVFFAWQQAIVDLSFACVKFERVLNKNEMKPLWDKVLYHMYLNYNTEKDFLPQFHNNMNSLHKLSEIASSLQQEPEAEEQATIKIKAKPVQWNERVSFECQKCGACCRHIKKSVPINSADMFRLAQFFKKSETGSVDMKSLLNKYAEPVLLHDCGYVMFTLKTTGPEDSCIFLKDNMCMIQEAKPLACRNYPFFTNPNERGSFDYYLSTEQPHHFKGRQIKVRDWMKHNFNREDQAFVNEDYAGAVEIIRLLQKVPESRKDEAMHCFIRFRYMEYNLEQPFFEQYKHNNELLMDYLRRLT